MILIRHQNVTMSEYVTGLKLKYVTEAEVSPLKTEVTLHAVRRSLGVIQRLHTNDRNIFLNIFSSSC